MDNVLLDFSHIYSERINFEELGLMRLDMSDIAGTNMYCSKDAADQIRKRLASFGPSGIHFLDSGNYHYTTLFFIEKIHEPFSLVLFDHHTDMQKPMIEHILSCGSWAAEALKRNPYLRQLILMGPEQTSMAFIDENLKSKLICISMEQIDEKQLSGEISKVNMSLPIYISIDKDVLSPYYARTNWNQGDMTVDILEKILLDVFAHQKVIGVDLCGECSLQEPLPELVEDIKINKKTNDNLYRYLIKLFKFQES